MYLCSSTFDFGMALSWFPNNMELNFDLDILAIRSSCYAHTWKLLEAAAI